MNKSLLGIVIFSTILVAGCSSKPSTPESPAEVAPTTPTATEAPVVEHKVVTYTDAGFAPATLKIKKGETVLFNNQSSKSMWTASAKHPTHLVYPTTGGCIGSTFDACKAFSKGESWPFVFDISGNWKYHNHLNPSHFGTIEVE
jgi:plastocyanin